MRGRRSLACIALCLILLSTIPRALADTGSAGYTFGTPFTSNESKYTIYFSVPPIIQVGVKTNLTFYLYMNEMTGWKAWCNNQILQFLVNTATIQVKLPRLTNNQTTYAGARWGPFNMTVDFNATQFGLSPGQSTNATLFADLVVYEQYNDPTFPYLVPSGSTVQLTQFQITTTSPSAPSSGANHLLTSAAVGAAVVLVLAGLSLLGRRRGSAGNLPVS